MTILCKERSLDDMFDVFDDVLTNIAMSGREKNLQKMCEQSRCATTVNLILSLIVKSKGYLTNVLE